MYLEVAVASPIAKPLTYKPNPDFPESRYKPGLRILVPLGPRLVTGYILHTHCSLDPTPAHAIRKVHDLLDCEPIFPESMVEFFEWLSLYYHYPIGEVIKCALPGGLTPQSGRRVVLKPKGVAKLSNIKDSHVCKTDWFKKLLSDGSISAAETRKLWRSKERELIKRWEKDGLITIEGFVSKDTIKERTETCYSLTAEKSDPLHQLRKPEERALSLLASIAENKTNLWVPQKEMTRQYSGARKALLSLHEKGLVRMDNRPVYRNPFGERPPSSPVPKSLTKEQKVVIKAINKSLSDNIFAPFLLHGVTGSGKTEVYLRAAKKTIDSGKTVLVLVPEIALATQLEGNFLSRFPDQVALLHSGLSKGEHFDQWRRILYKKASIVIGARSAVFAPLEDIGLIVIDEEHDSAYKQEDSFRYNARDAAVLRASQNKATVILGSATPSVVTYQHAQRGKYSLLNMTKRVENKSLPQVEIVDLKSIPTVSAKAPIFSPQLTKALKETLHNGDQSILFLNRRGYAQLMLCQSCGKTLQCSHCQISLTLHRKRNELACHYCGYTRKNAAVCPDCQSSSLIEVGFGTERIESEVRKILPQARIARLDRDTTLKRNDFIKTLRQVHDRSIDILIGTQMVAKGHHFPGVTFVGVIWADASLGIPDFKSSERTFQLLTQVFGRAGRGERSGRVIVQTHYPGHYCIKTSKQHDYTTLFDQEIQLRKTLQYPPFTRLVNFRFEGSNANLVSTCANKIADYIKRSKYNGAIAILGPSPAPLAILRNMHRWHLLMKSSKLSVLSTVCSQVQSYKTTLTGMSPVKLTVDVDPESML